MKLFVGGLSWQTEEEHLQHYFTQFGDIEAVQIMKDPFTLVSTHKQILVQKKYGNVYKVISNVQFIMLQDSCTLISDLQYSERCDS